MVFPYSLSLNVRGRESYLYPALRGVLVALDPSGDAVLPASYDDASREERATLDRILAALVRSLCEGPARQGGA